MNSPLYILVLFIGFILFFSPIEGKILLIIPFVLMLTVVVINGMMIKYKYIYNCKVTTIHRPGFIWNIALFFLMLFISNLTINYYTGLTLFSTLQNLINSDSNYNFYQSHFRENERFNFELKKLFYVSFISIIKITAFYYIYNFVFFDDSKLWSVAFLLPLIFFSIARGTSVEVFEMIIFLFSVLFLKSKLYHIKIMWFKYLPIAVLASVIFIWNISLRMDQYSLTNTCFGPFCYKSFFNLPFDNLFYFLGVYFFSGFYNLYLLYNTNGLFEILMPFNAVFTFSISEICKSKLVCGSWHPALVYLLPLLGILAIFFLFFLHKIVNIFLKKSRSAFMTAMVLYQYTYVVYSIFIGEGLFSSAPNKLILLITFLFLFIPKKINLLKS